MARHSKNKGQTSNSRQQTKNMVQSTRRASHGSSTDSSTIDDFQRDNHRYAVVSQEHSSDAGRDIPSHGAHDQRTNEIEIIFQPESRPNFQEELVAEVEGFYTGSVVDEAELIEVENQSSCAQCGSEDDNGRSDARWPAFDDKVDGPSSKNDFYDPSALKHIGSCFPGFTYSNVNSATYDQNMDGYPATSTYGQSNTTLEHEPVTAQFQLEKWVYESRRGEMSFSEHIERYNHVI